MLPQEEMIQTVRGLCESDNRVIAVLMYGSFAGGEGAEFSDVEFYLFFEDSALNSVEPEAWVSQIAPVPAFFVNEFGSGVAIFENLIRGEFPFEAACSTPAPDPVRCRRGSFMTHLHCIPDYHC